MEFVHILSVAYLLLGLSSVTSSTCKFFAVLECLIQSLFTCKESGSQGQVFGSHCAGV